MDDDVYLTISFVKVSRATAEEVVKALPAIAGLTSYNVYINEDPDAEMEDDDG